MRKRGPRSCTRPFGLITAGLFLFTACYVVDVDDNSRRRCRSDGTSMSLVAAGRSSNSGSSNSRATGTVQWPAERPAGRTAVDTRTRDQAPTASPSTGDRLQKDSSPAPRRPADRHARHAATPTPSGTTATPSPSRTGGCKGAP